MANQVHLTGTIGEVSFLTVGNLDVARFTVATEFIYTYSGDEWCNVTEWYPCYALVSEKIPDLSIFVKNDEVDLNGRLIFARFKDVDGEEAKPMVYVYVKEAKILRRWGKKR